MDVIYVNAQKWEVFYKNSSTSSYIMIRVLTEMTEIEKILVFYSQSAHREWTFSAPRPSLESARLEGGE